MSNTTRGSDRCDTKASAAERETVLSEIPQPGIALTRQRSDTQLRGRPARLDSTHLVRSSPPPSSRAASEILHHVGDFEWSAGATSSSHSGLARSPPIGSAAHGGCPEDHDVDHPCRRERLFSHEPMRPGRETRFAAAPRACCPHHHDHDGAAHWGASLGVRQHLETDFMPGRRCPAHQGRRGCCFAVSKRFAVRPPAWSVRYPAL